MSDQDPISSDSPLDGLNPEELLQRGLETVRQTSASTPKGWHPPDPEHLSRLLPQYRIESLVGRGGMGAVYRGIQANLERPVAIKLLPAEMAADAEFVARFQREARTLARLNHPGIVMVHEFGQTSEGHLFFVMEFVDGTDLHKIIHGPGLKSEQALEIVGQICDSLQYAHAQGVIHRDIKPANILLTRDGITKLADFGLARPLTEESGLMTRSNIVMGTPDYIAPEAMLGQADHRADLYALGVMLYEMLTGQTPRGAWARPSQRVQVDVRLDEVVIRALQQDPDLRYQQASEMRTDVDVIRTTPPPKAHGKAKPPKPAPTEGRRSRHRKSSTATWLVSLAALGAIAAGAFHFLPKLATPSPGRSEVAETTETSASSPDKSRSKPVSPAPTETVDIEEIFRSKDNVPTSSPTLGSPPDLSKPQWTSVPTPEELKPASGDDGWIVTPQFDVSKAYSPPLKFLNGGVRFKYRWNGDRISVTIRRAKGEEVRADLTSRSLLNLSADRTEDSPFQFSPTPIKSGGIGTIEMIALGTDAKVRLNGETFTIPSVAVTEPGFIMITGAGGESKVVEIKDVEYINLDEVPNDEAMEILGWDEWQKNTPPTPSSPANDSIPWHDFLAEIKSAPHANNQLGRVWTEEQGGWRVARYHAFALPDDEGRDLAVKLTGTFGPHREGSQIQGFAIHVRQKQEGASYSARLNNFNGGRAEIRKGPDLLTVVSLTPDFDTSASHTLEFRAEGDLLTLVVDGVEVSSTQDSTFPAGGSFMVAGAEGDLIEKVEYRYLDEPNETPVATSDNGLPVPDWLVEARQRGGKLKVAGHGPHGPFDFGDASQFDDFVQVTGTHFGWAARRANGEVYAGSWGRDKSLPYKPLGPYKTTFLSRAAFINMMLEDGTARNVWTDTSQQNDKAPPGCNRVIAALNQLFFLEPDGTQHRGFGGSSQEIGDFFKGATLITGTFNELICFRPGEPVHSWRPKDALDFRFSEATQNTVAMDGGHDHVIMLDASGIITVVDAEGTPLTVDDSRTKGQPQDEGSFIEVRAGKGMSTAQKTDGTWRAWGESEELANTVNKIGPALDLDLFHDETASFAIWIEPSTQSITASKSAPPPPSDRPATATPLPNPPTDDVDSRLAQLATQFQEAYDRDILPGHQVAVDDLDQKYLAAISRAMNAATKAAKLSEAVMLRDESNRIKNKEPLPATDPDTLPESLVSLRTTYREALAKLEEERNTNAKPYYDRYDALLDAYQTELTQQRRLDDAVRIKSVRAELDKARSSFSVVPPSSQ